MYFTLLIGGGSIDSDVDDNFDYMELLETQYAQYYAMTAVPPFDPNAPTQDDLLPPIPPLNQPSIVVASSGGAAVTLAAPTPLAQSTCVIDPVLAQALPGLAMAHSQATHQAAMAVVVPVTTQTTGEQSYSHVPPFDPAPSKIFLYYLS